MKPQTIFIFYDGECPMCTNYAQYYRLRDSNIKCSLVNLRNAPDKVAQFQAMGCDVDDGMIVELDRQIYHGARAINILALLGTPNGVFNRINRWVFSYRWLTKFLYPIMVRSRNLLLFLLRRPRIRTRDR